MSIRNPDRELVDPRSGVGGVEGLFLAEHPKQLALSRAVGIDQEMLTFAEELSKSKNTTLAFMGRKILFGTKINDIQTGTSKDFAGFREKGEFSVPCGDDVRDAVFYAKCTETCRV